MLKKSITVHSKMKSFYQMYEIMNRRPNVLVFIKAKQLKYILDTVYCKLTSKGFISVTFFGVELSS